MAKKGRRRNPDIIANLRERQKRNFLTTLLFFHGTPMLLAGGRFGRTQKGNNNGYCQDSEISWIDWNGITENDAALREFTPTLIALRASQPYCGVKAGANGLEIRWFNAGGGPQQAEQWDEGSTLGVSISRPDLRQEDGIWHDVLMLFNPFERDRAFQIPQFGEGDGCWSCLRQRTLPPDSIHRNRRVRTGRTQYYSLQTSLALE